MEEKWTRNVGKHLRGIVTFRIQKYFKQNEIQISIKERQLIFKLRSKVTNVKMNFRGMHEELTCQVSKIENETQEHVLESLDINN